VNEASSAPAERRLGWPKIVAWLAVLAAVYVWGLSDYEFKRGGVQSTGALVAMFFILAGLCYVVALLFTLVVKRRRPRALGVMLLLTFQALLLAWFPTNRHQQHGPAQIRNHFTPGNLQSTHALGCIPLERASNQYSPPDLYHGVAACLDEGNVPAAVQLHLLAETYGNFDMRRVSDRSAHQALRALWYPVFRNRDRSQREAWMKEAIRVQQDAPTRAAMCANLRRIGPPAYYPRYMIQHGMGAFTGNDGKDALVPGFDAAQTWERMVTNPMLCGTAADVGKPH
jgi:hypothetical protein